MIAGLPWQAWLLLLISVGLGLAIEITFFRAHRKERRERGGTAPGSGGAASPSTDPEAGGADDTDAHEAEPTKRRAER